MCIYIYIYIYCCSDRMCIYISDDMCISYVLQIVCCRTTPSRIRAGSVSSWRGRASMQSCTCMFICNYMCMCVCMHVCMYVCMYIYIYIYVYMYICIYTPMYAPRPPPGSARPRPRRRPRRSSARPPAECGFGPCRVVYTSTRSLLGWLETRLAQIT